jgi:hypothetical protein
MSVIGKGVAPSYDDLVRQFLNSVLNHLWIVQHLLKIF